MHKKFVVSGLFVLVMGIMIGAWALLPTTGRAGSAANSSVVVSSGPSNPGATSSGSVYRFDAAQQQWIVTQYSMSPSGPVIDDVSIYQSSYAPEDRSGSLREQDALLERLLAEPHLAELAQLTPARCDDECLTLLTQQMLDFAAQVRQGW